MQLLRFLILTLILCPAAAAAAETTFLIFPLENQTGLPALHWVGEAVSMSISEACQVPGIDTIGWEDRVRFVEASDLPPNATLSRASMIRVAQRAGADFLVFGGYSGTEAELEIGLQVLDLHAMKLSGEKGATGPVSALPELENALGWALLSDTGVSGALTRSDFLKRIRVVPNQAYAEFVQAFATEDAADRVAQVQKILDRNRFFPQASFLVGSWYFENGDCGRAVEYLKPALQGAQNYPEAQFMLGNCYLKQNKPAEAIASYSAALPRAEGKTLELNNNLGVAYLRKGDMPLAVQLLVEAHRQAETDVTVGVNLAILRRLLGEGDAEMTLLEGLVLKHADQGLVQYLYGTALARGGDAQKAQNALEEARRLEINPEAMKKQDPRTWLKVFPVWMRHPATAMVGRDFPAGDTIRRHRH